MCQKEITMKRKLEDSFCEDDWYISRPTKRITMCHNTPKQAKDEKKKLMKTSKRKLKQMDHPESNLRRSVLVNNVYKRLQNELRQEKSNKYYGYAFNPKCPFGFGAGIKELTQRKRQAKLEQVLNEKCRNYEKLSINQAEDLSASCDKNIDVCSRNKQEQLSMYVECSLDSTQQNISTSQDSFCNESLGHSVNEASVCDSLMDSANLQQCDKTNVGCSKDLLSSATCDIINQQQTVLVDNLCQFSQPQNFSITDNSNQMDCSSINDIKSCDTTALEIQYTCDNTVMDFSHEQHTVVEYDSENEEIDVCSCEDDDQNSSNTTAAKGLLLQQIQSSSLHNNSLAVTDSVVTTQSSSDYQTAINQVDSIKASMDSAATSGLTLSEIPPKVEEADDICDNNNKTDQQSYMNSVFSFTGVENNLNSYPQGHLHSIYQGPFCHPLLSSPFYQGFMSSFNPSVANAAVSNYYNQQSYNPSLYNGYGGIYNSEVYHGSNSSNAVHSNTANMVTCT